MKTYPRINKSKILYLSTLLLICISCKKLIEIPPPASSITSSQVFSTDAEATAAMAGVYYGMVNNSIPIFASGGMTIYGGLSADELQLFDITNTAYYQFYQNSLPPTNGLMSTIWDLPYSYLYGTNAVIGGLTTTTTVHDSVKTELIGEAKFVRAFINFYLVNLYGNIPLVTTTNWRKTNVLNRSPSADVYQAIIADLKDAQAALPSNYSVSNNNKRIIPNKWAATALLSRVYLYTKQYSEAETASTAVINSGLYSLVPDLNGVFLTNSSEAIWQLQQDNTGWTLNATNEGFNILPYPGGPPFVYITSHLYNSFETGDNRKNAWLENNQFGGQSYFLPYKYKVGSGDATPNGNITEYYMVLRLAEQYLIRAEARANLREANAVSDLNIIRNRAGLTSYSGATDQTSLLSAISHENQVEFFAEWGHRWLDLKRIGQATQILSANKGFTVNSNSLLYPIPVSELIADPNLTQNPGY